MYRTQGNKFLDNGVEFQMHAINLTGMETPINVIHGLWADRTIAEFLDVIKSLGFNTLRLPIDTKTISNVALADPGSAGVWQGSKNEKTLKGKRSMEICDVLIDECEKRGLRYFFDIHNHDKDGDLPPRWYFEGYTEENWISDITTLASRYKGKPGFIGIDSFNEPAEGNWGKGGADDFRGANERAFAAMASVNDDVIIIIEGWNQSNGSSWDYIEANPPNIPKDRLAWSRHYYQHDVWSGPGWAGDGLDDPNFPKNMAAVYQKLFVDFASRNPFIVGEFGGKFEPGSKDREGQIAIVDVLRKNKISAAYWVFQETSGDTGGLIADGGYVNLRLDKVDLLKTLRTDKATYTTDKKPEPEKPIVPTTPTVFAPSDLVQMISGGPNFVVHFSDKDKTSVLYYNAIPGTIEKIDLPTVCLKKVTLKSKASDEIGEIYREVKSLSDEELAKREKWLKDQELASKKRQKALDADGKK